MELILNVFTLLSVVLFMPNLEGKPTEPCVYQINTCACKTRSGFINLEPLDKAKETREPYFRFIIDEYSDASYGYNPCTPFSTVEPCLTVAGCQHTGGGPGYSLGTQGSANFTLNSKNETVLEYRDTTVKNGRSMIVLLLCEPEEEGNIIFFSEDPQLTYNFVLKTKYACADLAPPAHKDNITTVTTPVTPTTSTTTTPSDCHCDNGLDLKYIIVTLVTVTVCVCFLILVMGAVYMLVNKCKQETMGMVNSQKGGQGNAQYQYESLPKE